MTRPRSTTRATTRYAKSGAVHIAYQVVGALQGVPSEWRLYRARG